jgi:hypothetical protein
MVGQFTKRTILIYLSVLNSTDSGEMVIVRVKVFIVNVMISLKTGILPKVPKRL